jgi:hypothetical protein
VVEKERVVRNKTNRNKSEPARCGHHLCVPLKGRPCRSDVERLRRRGQQRKKQWRANQTNEVDVEERKRVFLFVHGKIFGYVRS